MVANMYSDVKCVVVGDGGVGKTSMLIRYINGQFMDDYAPTCFDSYAVTLDLDEQYYDICLIDTAGQETYDRLRTLSYFNTDVFVVCFSVASSDSLINVKTRWIPELKVFKPNTRFILVGTQSDIRDEGQSTESCVTTSQGKKIARKLGAECYIECSSLTGKGLSNVFEGALQSVVHPKKKKRLFSGLKHFFKWHTK